MTRVDLFSAFALLLSAQLPAPARASEMQIRQEIVDKVHALVQARDFPGLSAMERDFRARRERTPSGTWKLQEFYIGLDLALPQPSADSGNCRIPAETFIDDWTKGTPRSPAPHIIRAKMLLQRAWCFRGDGYAAEVAQDAWQPVNESGEAAQTVLIAHKAFASADPEYYAVLEDIYRSEGREPVEFRKLLDEGTAKTPTYYGLYWNAYTYYQPQWFGSPDDVEALARYAIERTRAADGTGAYARLYWHASGLSCGCWLEAIDWPTMKVAMRDVSQRYPDPWNYANFAKLSCRFADKDEARRYFEALKDDDGSAAWWGDKQAWQQCRALAGLS